jgi:hypothetical protein
MIQKREHAPKCGSNEDEQMKYTQLGITGNYNAVAISTFYSLLLQTLVSSVYYTLH